MSIEPLSQYARFHILFIGYDFYDNRKKRIISKYELWHGFNHLCMIMVEKKKVLSRFTLVDREGWRKGDLIETEI